MKRTASKLIIRCIILVLLCYLLMYSDSGDIQYIYAAF